MLFVRCIYLVINIIKFQEKICIGTDERYPFNSFSIKCTPCQNEFHIMSAITSIYSITYHRLHRKIILGSFNTGPFFATLMAQSRDCAKNPYNMGFWHCLSILAPLQSVAIEIECSALASCKIKNSCQKNTHSKHCQTDFCS